MKTNREAGRSALFTSGGTKTGRGGGEGTTRDQRRIGVPQMMAKGVGTGPEGIPARRIDTGQRWGLVAPGFLFNAKSNPFLHFRTKSYIYICIFIEVYIYI